MITYDMRSAELRKIDSVSRQYSAYTHHMHSRNHVHRDVTNQDISECSMQAIADHADMMMILNYGIDWYIPIANH